jgi:hypothetical protein
VEREGWREQGGEKEGKAVMGEGREEESDRKGPGGDGGVVKRQSGGE